MQTVARREWVLDVLTRDQRPANWLTAAELKTLLGMGRNTVHKWLHRGQIVPVAVLAVEGRGGPPYLFLLSDAIRCRALMPRQRKGFATGGAPPLPPHPTYTRPGSPERVRVYEERADAGFGIFHPADERIAVPSYLGRGVA